MSWLKIENLYLRFKNGSDYIADGLSARFDNPGLVVVFGNNGTGKTSLLKAIMRIHQRGTFEIQEGKISVRDPEAIAYLSQSPRSQILTFRVKDELAVPLSFRGEDKNERATFVEMVSQKFGLADILLDDPSKVSSGQIQTVLIASSSGGNPEIILMDEPTSNLDKTNRLEFLKTIRDTKKRALIIVTTQRPWQFSSIADYSFRMHAGKLIHEEIPNHATLPLQNLVEGTTYTIRTGYSTSRTEFKINLSPEHPNILTGPNGSGKTLLLLSLNGSLDMESNMLPDISTKSLYLPSDTIDFFSQPTVEEEWQFYCGSEIPELIRSVKDRSPFTFSSGEIKFFALNILFNSSFDYLLLDEPSSNLDRKNTKWLINQILQTKKKLIIATNDQLFLDEFAKGGLSCCLTELTKE